MNPGRRGQGAFRFARAALALAAVALLPAALWGHPWQDPDYVPPDGLYAKLFIEPDLLIVLGLLTLAVAWVLGPLRRQHASEVSPRRAWAFYLGGVAFFYLGAGTSIDEIGESYLFWMHMVQHMIFMYLAAPLLVAAVPEWFAERLGRSRVWGPLARFWTHPVVACVTYSAVFGLWHIPALYDWALRDQLIHNLEHATMLGASVLMWWPLIGPRRGVPRAGHAVALFYLLGLTILNMPLFAFLTFAKRVLYPTYAAAPRIIEGMDAFQDQVLGGALMKISGMLVLFGLMVVIFLRWYREVEAREGNDAVLREVG